ncbi:MAG: zinc-ribbon domain-containing protein [Ruminococcus sp.]
MRISAQTAAHTKAENEEIGVDNTSSQRFCENCGTEISEDADFCPNCGTKQTGKVYR